MERYMIRGKKRIGVKTKEILKKAVICSFAFSVGAIGRIAYDFHNDSLLVNATDSVSVGEEQVNFSDSRAEMFGYAQKLGNYTFKDITQTQTADKTSAIFAGETALHVVGVRDLNISPISVSCLKVSWTPEPNRSYETKVITDAPYSENIRIVYKGNGLVYLTGLRENSEYTVEVSPINIKPDESALPERITGKTECVLPLVEYGKEEGWTSCFCYEKASGLTRMPSSGAIAGTITDPITDTGIRRNKYGDYCCAMGLWYGTVGDRFLIELENGIQFTTQICDSKGWGDDADGDGICDGRFHWYGYGNGKCVIEFIYNDGSLPSCVTKTGSYGYWNWGGLNLGSNIEKIQKISSEGNVVTY